MILSTTIWLVTFLHGIYSRIFVHLNGTILDDFEPQELIYHQYIFPVSGDVYEAGAACREFTVKTRPAIPGMIHFILIHETTQCTPYTQVHQALREGHRNIMIGANWNDIKDHISLIENDSYLLEGMVIILTIDNAKTLSAHTASTGALLYITWEELNRFFVIFMPIIILGCILLIMGMIGGMVAVSKHVYKKLKVRRDRSRILRLPTRKYTDDDKDETCPICFEEYMLKDVLTILKCNHEYHQACLAMWAGRDCPLCRAPMLDQGGVTRSLLRLFNPSRQYAIIPEDVSDQSQSMVFSQNVSSTEPQTPDLDRSATILNTDEIETPIVVVSGGENSQRVEENKNPVI